MLLVTGLEHKLKSMHFGNVTKKTKTRTLRPSPSVSPKRKIRDEKQARTHQVSQDIQTNSEAPFQPFQQAIVGEGLFAPHVEKPRYASVVVKATLPQVQGGFKN